MKRAIAIMATAALTASLLTTAADARGGGGGFGGGGHMGGFGGGAHIGGAAGGHIGGFAGGPHIGGMGAGTIGRLGGGVHVGSVLGSDTEHSGSNRIGPRNHSPGFSHHAMRRFGRVWNGDGPYYGYDPDCYDLYYRHPNDTWPPSCS